MSAMNCAYGLERGGLDAVINNIISLPQQPRQKRPHHCLRDRKKGAILADTHFAGERNQV